MSRLIPAHAGKTVFCVPLYVRGTAHPRSRGENRRDRRRHHFHDGSSPLTRGKPIGAINPGYGGGSSPLTRGKPVSPSLRFGGLGLIPAHAGKTTFGILHALV